VVPQVSIGQEEGLAVVLLMPGSLGQPGQPLLPLLVGFEPGDDVHERPTRPDGGQLIWIADQDQAAHLVQIERPEQHPEQVHRDHRRLVDDDGRGAVVLASLELEGEVLRVEPLVAHQELVDRQGVPHRPVRTLGPLHEPDSGLAGRSQQQRLRLFPFELFQPVQEDLQHRCLAGARPTTEDAEPSLEQPGECLGLLLPGTLLDLGRQLAAALAAKFLLEQLFPAPALLW